MDYRYPLIIDTDLLKKLIFQGKVKENQLYTIKLTSILTQLTGRVSWRQPGITYAK